LLPFPSFFLGSLQQCGELLWRECQDDSTLCVLPRVCALHQSVQGEDSKLSSLCADRVKLSLLVIWAVPWAAVGLAQSRAGQSLAAVVPQDVACSSRPKNRKDQLGLTLELQLCRLDCPPFSSSSSLPPDSRTQPHHTAHFLRLFSVRIYVICSRKCAIQGFQDPCVCLTVYMRLKGID